MPDELETLLKLYGRKAGVYQLHNGQKIKVWYEGEELKTEEIQDDEAGRSADDSIVQTVFKL